MPVLDWIGKQAVVNHHKEVPYRLLHCDSKLSFGDPDSGNLIVQGDNLEALKALLPYYKGQVDCIFIALLHDGRILVIEYKGAHLYESEEVKRQIGNFWAEASDGKCLFCMPTAKNYKLIEETINGV